MQRMQAAGIAVILVLCVATRQARAQAPTVQREFSVGCASCGGALEFSRVDDVSLSPRGEIAVVNSDAPMLRLFNAAGKPMWQGGASGKGPGEYTAILRAAFAFDGGLKVLDASGMRVTVLGPNHTVQSTTPLVAYPTTAGVNDNGLIITGAEDRRGGFTMSRVTGTATTAVTLPLTMNGKPITSFRGTSIAVSASGAIAVIPHTDHYEILRFDSVGNRLADIVRTIERPKFTAEEIEANKATAARISGEMAAMIGARSGTAPKAATAIGGGSPETRKSHAAQDGLRYDGKGRLWVLTMRGGTKSSVFDVFAPGGAFLGALTLPEVTKLFALGGDWLVTSSENDDGVPIVTRWSVR